MMVGTPKAPQVQRDDQAYLDLMARSASVLDVVQWVAKNLEIPEHLVRLEDAPSAEAWGMLVAYRSPLRRGEFWDKVYTKLIPSRAQLGDAEKPTVDGIAVIDAIGKILAMREKAEG